MPDMWMDVDAALSEVPINIMPLLDDGDFKTREESVVYNQAGLDLVWNFVTSAGAMSQTAVTPTDTAGDYDWVNQSNGMYSIEIPASGGASANNDTEGFGWFTGYATGVLPWRGPVIGFRAAALNNALIDGGDSLDVDMVTAVLNKVADHVLRRTVQNALDSSDGDAKTFRSLVGAVSKLVNKISVSGGNLLITEDDDATTLGTQAITTAPGADPISALDTV